jgi:hypothetical protein
LPSTTADYVAAALIAEAGGADLEAAFLGLTGAAR